MAVEEQFISLKRILQKNGIPFNDYEKLSIILATCEISHKDIVEMKKYALELYKDYVGNGGIE